MDSGTSETLSDIWDAVERLCKETNVRFDPYSFKTSINRAVDKLKKNKALSRRTITAEEEY